MKKKTVKAAAKRFRKSAGGKLSYKRAGSGHLLSSKSRKRKRSLRRRTTLSPTETRRIMTMI